MKLKDLFRKRKTSKNLFEPSSSKSDIEKFIIISIPRTGSNLLCGALDAHPEIICHYELFHKEAIYHSSKYGDECVKGYTVEKRNNAPKAFLNHIFSFRFNKPVKTIGYKIFAEHNDKLLEDLINDRDVKKIILKRDNQFLAYLSQLEAQKTGVFVITEENQKKANYDFKVTINFSKFKYFEKKNTDFFKKIETKLENTSQDFLTLEYITSLNKNNRIKMLKFLNVTVKPDLLVLEYEKQNKRKLEERIENYSEVLEKFTGTVFEKYLP